MHDAYKFTVYSNHGYGRGPTIAAAATMQQRQDPDGEIVRLTERNEQGHEEEIEIPPHDMLAARLLDHAHADVWDAICALRVAARLSKRSDIERIAKQLDDLHTKLDALP